ncbi:MAG: GNAT family N-acetyltransferase [Acholeplasmataceae bacterium]|nr:GNAT family N-acetyltransferase [Acholeplasmataceae bacterium]
MIRTATTNDLDQIWLLREETRVLLHDRGIDQWQHTNPSFETFKNDIRLGEFYVYEKDGNILGMIAIKGGIEKTYNIIYDGKWGYDLPYLTIHRLAVKRDLLGGQISRELLKFADHLALEKGINYIRIDTYYTNKYAIRLFQEFGYILRGWILLEPGEGDLKRLAFDKLL